MVNTEQNRKEPKKTPQMMADKLAAQVPKTFSKVGQLMTDDGDALTGKAFPVTPDPVGPMSDGTKAPNMPEAMARTVDKTKSVETSANAAKASITSNTASKMARTRPDTPEVAREVTKNKDVTKTAVQQPKCECDTENDSNRSSPRQRFVEHPVKLPMHVPASEIEQGGYDKFYESTANNKNGPMTQTRSGVQKVGTAGTAGAIQTTCGWTK
jgi:hypothetical protein